ncbi:MAG: NUDIX hydrolase [Bacteroidota bacterium]|nr:NUDIX hydrolase [Bacteroidota bacterium]
MKEPITLGNREPLLALLRHHRTSYPEELNMLEEMIRFVTDHPDCFERSLLEGHVTGSAWIVNPERSHVLLMHHFKLDKWVQPGGHCDGDPDVMAVAIREAEEETGLFVVPITKSIFDLDIHTIPAKGDVPEHLHYDIRWLMEAAKGDEDLPNNHESHAIRWIKMDEVHRYTSSDSVLRMLQKTAT